jgi:hypothetical protein
MKNVGPTMDEIFAFYQKVGESEADETEKVMSDAFLSWREKLTRNAQNEKKRKESRKI